MTEEDAIQSSVWALNRALDSAGPSEVIIEAARAVPEGRLAVVSSFGAESAVLLKLVADIDRSMPVVFLDTGWLFEETIDYRDALTSFLGLTDVRSFSPSPNSLAKRDPQRDLWSRDADACCGIRKVTPLADALTAFDGWLSGRKRYQGGDRVRLPVVERDGRRLKFNPLARTTQADVEHMFEEANLPRHPLQSKGFSSVGCIPCTSHAATGDDPRAGRWRGLAKTECGIHAPLATQRGNESTRGVDQRDRHDRRNAEAQQT